MATRCAQEECASWTGFGCACEVLDTLTPLTCTCGHGQHMHDDWGCFDGVGTSERCGCGATR